MKKIIIWILLAAILLGMLAYCGKSEDPTQPSAAPVETTEAPVGENNAAEVTAYLQAIYKDSGAKTSGNFERFGIVRIAGVPYEVVWTADVSEDLVKIIVNDDGTVTIDVNEKCTEDTVYVLTATVTDANGNTSTASWEYLLPGAASLEEMQAIVDQAYALEKGEAMAEEVTLTGVITSIDTVWSDQYQNITVTIAVEGREDKTIQCYRLKGEGAKDLIVGDTITVQGTLKNYNGTIEFDAGCTLVAVEKTGVPVEIPTDPHEIMEDVYALGNNESLPYGPVTLTGNICSIDTAYSEQYDNITVTIQIDYYTIKCYRLSGEGVEDLEMNDIITVKGYIKKYNGTREFEYPELLDVVKVGAYPQPKDQVEIVEAAYNLDPGWTLPYSPVTLTGTITKAGTWSDEYENVTVTFAVEGAENMPIKCYRMTYSDEATKEAIKSLAKGDVITVRGMLINYQDTKTGYCTIEFNYPELLSVTKAEIDSDSTAPLLTTKPKDGDIVIFVNLEAAMSKNASGSKMGTETAQVSGTTLAVTDDMARVKVSVDSNGYYTFTVGGKYLTSGKTGNALSLESTASDYSLWTLEDAGDGAWYIKSVNAVYNGNNQYIETYDGEFTTFSFKEANSKFYKIFMYVSPDDGTTDSGDSTTEDVYMTSAPKNGDKVVIVAPNYGKALSTVKAGYNNYYNAGVDVTVSNGKLTGYSDSEVWTVIVNDDGSYSFANGGQNIGLAASNSSMNLGAVNDDWNVNPLDDGLYNIVNIGRSGYAMEWYSSNNNWSTYYKNITTDDQFFMAFYLVEEADEPSPYMTSAPKNGDQVVIVAPAYNKALSTVKTGYNNYYNAGVDVTASNGKLTGYSDSEVWTVIVNADGSYSFANGGQNIGLAASNSSMNLGAVNDDWNVNPLDDGLYNIVNIGRSGYAMEWYSSNNNWSTYYKNITTDDQFFMAFYLVAEGSGSGDSGDSDSGNTDSATATITFDDTAKRTVGTTSQQVWVENGITVTNDKAASSSDVNTNYYNPVRFYKSSSVTIAYPGMTKIEVACNNTTYATALVNSISNATASASGTVVTIELSSAVDSFTISAMSAQVRVDSITVYAEPQVTINKISEALAAESGEFTVEGVVTLVDGKNIYVQDGTGAICVRMSSTPSDISLGDTIIGTGSKTTYSGLPQLENATYEKSSGMTLSVKETTIDALTTADLCTYVKISEVTVTEVYDNNGSYTTPNITVEDAAGNTIQIYKAVVGKTGDAWDIKVGNVLTVSGAVGCYNTTLQLRNTTTSEIVVTSQGDAEGEGDEGGNQGEPTTVTVSIADYATANGWEDATQYTELKMDDNITITLTYTSDWNNTGKYYTNGNNWRIYQNENPTITVTANGKTIASVKITYSTSKSGVLTLNGSNVSSGTAVDVNAASVAFGVGNTGTATNGQVRITAIEVIYQ